MTTKYIFITGGVVSSLGKGIASASLASLLESRGLNITMLKLDPYINVDPGTMSPFQHGEVFVTNDGTLLEYQVNSVTQGKDALAKVICKVAFEEHEAMIGHGLNIDTMLATARAYLGALNSYLSVK